MKTRTVLLGLLLFAAAGATGRAANDVSAPAGVESSLSTGKWRDPFWPIDYFPVEEIPEPEVKPPPVKPVVPRTKPRARIEWPELVVSAQWTRADGKAIALVDNVGLVEVGEEISVVSKGIQYSWRVESIDKDGAHLARKVARPVKR